MSLFEFEPDAGNYSVPETIDRFVPSSVWDTVRHPVNQLLYGGKGSGKTMLLKRLSWPAMLRSPAFLSDARFVAFYCDLRHLDLLASLAPPDIAVSNPRFTHAAALMSSFTTVHLMRSVIDDMLLADDFSDETIDEIGDAILEAVNRVCRTCFVSPRHSLQQAHHTLGEVQNDILDAVSEPLLAEELVPRVGGILSPYAAFSLTTRMIHERCRSLRLGILFDQYELMPNDFQPLITPFIKRQASTEFFCCIAARPYSVPFTGPAALHREDFQFSIVEFLPEQFDEYLELLKEIGLKLAGTDLDDLLEGGIRYFAQMSSRSIRTYLSLIRRTLELGTPVIDPIPRRIQDKAALEDSNAVRDLLAGIDGISTGSIGKLLLQIRSRAAGMRLVQGKDFPGQIQFESTDLINEVVDQRAVSLLRKAFEHGVFQFASRTAATSFILPNHWSLAPILGPAYGGIVRDAVRVKLSPAAITGVLKRRPPEQPNIPGTQPVDLRRAFLARSFEEYPELRIAAQKIIEVFQRDFNIDVRTGNASGFAMLDQIVHQIRDSQATIVDMQHLKPNVVLEMGITLGCWKRVIPILLQERRKDREYLAFPFLASVLPKFYSLDENGIHRLGEEIITSTRTVIPASSMLAASMESGARLRVSATPRTACLYYSETRKPLWSNLDDFVRSIASSNRYRLLIAARRPHERLRSDFENLIWAVSKSDRIIIDTSGVEGPDLYGVFGLGFAVGASHKGGRKYTLRIEESNLANPDALSMWPNERYRLWRGPEELEILLTEFLR